MIDIDALLQPIKTRIVNMVGRSVIKAASESKDGITLKLDLLADETRDEIELFQDYGFASFPKKDCQAITIFPAGSRDHGIVIATEDARYRIQGMKEGEVAIYTDEGDKIHLKRGRAIEVETKTLVIKASDSITLDTPQVTGTGEIADSVGDLSSLRDNYNKHTHVGNLGSATSPPDSPDPGPPAP